MYRNQYCGCGCDGNTCTEYTDNVVNVSKPTVALHGNDTKNEEQGNESCWTGREQCGTLSRRSGTQPYDSSLPCTRHYDSSLAEQSSIPFRRGLASQRHQQG